MMNESKPEVTTDNMIVVMIFSMKEVFCKATKMQMPKITMLIARYMMNCIMIKNHGCVDI